MSVARLHIEGIADEVHYHDRLEDKISRLEIMLRELRAEWDEFIEANLAATGDEAEPSPGHSSGSAGDEGAVRPPSFTLRAPGPPVACSERRSNVIHKGYPSVYRPVT